MPHWEGIHDSSNQPEPIWFTRSPKDASTISGTSTSVWKPLRKIDCYRLNSSSSSCRDDEQQLLVPIPIDGGRMSANIPKRSIHYNFYRQDVVQDLCSSFWFYDDETTTDCMTSVDNHNGGHHHLQPISCQKDCNNIEALYQSAIQAFSSLDDNNDDDDDEEGGPHLPQSLLQMEIPLTAQETTTTSITSTTTNTQTQYVAFLSYDPKSKVVAIRKRPASNQLASYLESPTLLRRGGYGPYTVDGEEEECTLGPVGDLIFVIHGIGEAFFSKDTVDIPDWIDEMDLCRKAMHRRQIELWKKECATHAAEGRASPPPPKRVELLPILWYDRIHNPSNSLKVTLNSITLPAVPELRMVANDVIFDVLMYLTPEYCQDVLECVTDQISDLYTKFQTIHKNFLPSGGKCSIIGHSLGSVITWDLLSLLKKDKESKGQNDVNTVHQSLNPLSLSDCVSTSNNTTYIPSTTTEIFRTLPFEPKFTFLLGSPVGLFLTLRGANKYFEKLRLLSSKGESTDSTSTSPFTLPTGTIYNIFHPSDPVAYRIEPLLLPPGPQQGTPPPEFLITKEGGMRTHMVLKQIGEDLQKTLKDGVTKLLSKGSSNRAVSVNDDVTVQKDITFLLGGRNNSRVDYMIQKGLLDDEYISAVSAHSSYFKNNDVIDFIIQKSYEN